MDNNKTDTDGIVIINQSIERSKDPYHIGSKSHDVLVLEICSLQASKEQVVECLTTQQGNLSHHSYNVLDVSFGVSIGFAVGFLLAAIFIRLMRRS